MSAFLGLSPKFHVRFVATVWGLRQCNLNRDWLGVCVCVSVFVGMIFR